MIDDELCSHWKAMVGFRNIAVHDCQTLPLEIVQAIMDRHLGDFKAFAEKVREYV